MVTRVMALVTARSYKRKVLVPLRRLVRKVTGGWRIYREVPISSEDLMNAMRTNAIPSRGFFLMLALSGIIATLGLIADSAPAIIGAMIIAPLMAPIVSAAYGIACTDRKLVLLSMITVLAGSLLVILIAFLGVVIIGVRIAGEEIIARASPSMLDLGVALAAGCAAAFAQTRPGIASSIAGVAIAVALVPPLAVTGIGLALGSKATSETGLSLGEFGLYSGGSDIAAGAFLLFLTNLIGILVIAAAVFVVLRYGDWRKATVTLAIVTIVSVFFVPALNEALHEIYVKNRVIRLHVKRAGAHLNSAFQSSAVKIERVNVAYRDDILHVNIKMFVTRNHLEGAQERLDEFRALLSHEIGEPVVIEIGAIPIDYIEFRSAPKILE